MTYSNMLQSFDDPLLNLFDPVYLDAVAIANHGYTGCDLVTRRIPEFVFFRVQPTTSQDYFGFGSFLDQHFCQNGERVVLKLLA